MRIGLIGAGRMSAAVEEGAAELGSRIVERFDTGRPLTSVSPATLTGLDVMIDFSSPAVFLEHVRACVSAGVSLVVGTTGVDAQLPEARSHAERGSGSILYSPNFSIGIAILRAAVRATAALITHFDDYDILIQDVHHAAKRDRPSGTALLLERDLDGVSKRIEVTSARIGRVVGEHAVRFDGPDDQIELRHVARSRQIFARGAIEAAGWLTGRTGFFTLDDMLEDWINENPALHGNGHRTGHTVSG